MFVLIKKELKRIVLHCWILKSGKTGKEGLVYTGFHRIVDIKHLAGEEAEEGVTAWRQTDTDADMLEEMRDLVSEDMMLENLK